MTCTTDYGTYEVRIVKREYAVGGIALSLESKCDYGWEPFARISVRLDDEACDNGFFVDSNNSPFAERFLKDNGIAEPTGRIGFSGFCSYPEYRLVKPL